MKIQTMSVVVGTKACNAKCPFCVSRMTGMDVLPKTQDINNRNLDKATALAKLGGVTTVLFTGKGEPTLYPDQITEYLWALNGHFPFMELQTNALLIGKLAAGEKAGKLTREVLERWYLSGLDTICISTVGIKPEHNRKVYLNDHGEYPDLATTIAFLHDIGFQVRLCVMMQQGMTDTPEKVAEVIDWCRFNRVAQLTVRPINKPANGGVDSEVYNYTKEQGLDPEQAAAIYKWIRGAGKLLLSLMHDAEVYDVGGQNICISDCLTHSSDPNQLRQIIFYADGRLAYNWTDDGATLLQGKLT